MCLFFNKLFDSTNNCVKMDKSKGKVVRCAISDESPYSSFWTEAKPILNSMKFINRRKGTSTSTPTIKNSPTHAAFVGSFK